MTVLTPKRSSESSIYVFDWTRELAPTNDSIASYVLAITSGTITAPAASQSASETSVQALIVGGANGETATLTLTVTTVGGQVLVRDLTLFISDTADAVISSTTTKGQIEDMAYEEIGLAGYEFDATPEEQASGLRRLDGLQAMWVQMGLNLGYNFPHAVGGSDRSDPSGIPDFALDGVVVKLALSIMPLIGKTMSPETRLRMQESMSAIRTACAVIPERTLPHSTLRGAGNKPRSVWAPYTRNGQG